VVGCEPQVVLSGEDYEDMLMELSKPVHAAVEEAVKLVEALIDEIGEEGDKVRLGH
jgi:Ni,Fe-hydrogenase maturation factor